MNDRDSNNSTTTFNPACQKIIDAIPDKLRTMVISGLACVQSPADFTPELLLSVLKDIFDIDIKDVKAGKYDFPDAPLKTALALELSSDQPELSMEAMSMTVAALRKHYLGKGMEFNCTVSSDEDLDLFLNSLNTNRQQIKDQTRFQLLSFNKSNKHWSVIDIRLNKGIIEFYLLDAAYFSNRDLIIKIFNLCPDILIRYSSGHIQTDLTHCAIFALDHVIQLAKIPEFHDKLGTIKSYPLSGEMPNIQFIPHDNLLPEFGPLLRNMQSLKKIAKLCKEINGISGNRNVDINTYLNTKNRKRKTVVESVIVEQNISITLKCTILKARALDYLLTLQNDDDCKQIIDKFKIKPLAITQSSETPEQHQPDFSHMESTKNLISNYIFSLYGAFEIIEMLSFELEFKCADLFAAIMDKDEIDIKRLILIAQNREPFKELYKNGILSIERIHQMDFDEMNKLLYTASHSNQPLKTPPEQGSKRRMHELFTTPDKPKEKTGDTSDHVKKAKVDNKKLQRNI